jgi:hypothetical protein
MMLLSHMMLSGQSDVDDVANLCCVSQQSWFQLCFNVHVVYQIIMLQRAYFGEGSANNAMNYVEHMST